MTIEPNPNIGAGVLGEALVSFITALLAVYVRAKNDPHAWGWRGLLAKIAEAATCGAIAMGIAALLSFNDPRATVGISAALGLLSTQALTDLIVRVANRKADRM